MKENAEALLREVYEKYKNSGVASIYLWGSVTTGDFNPETSDIDSVAIVEDSTDLTLEDEVKKIVSASNIPVSKFGFRILYKGELNGGPIKSFLARVIDPACLLLDLPYWELVAGNNFSQKDFKLKVPSFKEAISQHVKKFEGFGWLDVSKIPEKQHKQLMKTCARIIDLEQQERGVESDPFSYSKIYRNSVDGQEKEITKAILENKNQDFNFAFFALYVPLFQKYVDYLINKNING